MPNDNEITRSLKRSVTAHDVAKVAGVSQSAVSRHFTPGASISEKTRKKIIEAAEQLGYRPNLIARSLITKKSTIFCTPKILFPVTLEISLDSVFLVIITTGRWFCLHSSAI